jgi:hypothetical protein
MRGNYHGNRLAVTPNICSPPTRKAAEAAAIAEFKIGEEQRRRLARPCGCAPTT